MKTLEALFLEELAGVHDAENRLAKALTRMAKATTHADLRRTLKDHQLETLGHTARLKTIFQQFGKRPRSRRCEAIIGLLKECDALVKSNASTPTLNAAIVAAAQKIEHYEIATYGCLREWAKDLGNERVAGLLQEILDEEKAADQKLTECARHHANETAQTGDGPNYLLLTVRTRRNGFAQLSLSRAGRNGHNHTVAFKA